MSDKSKKNIDPKPIKDLAKILEELNLTEVSYSDGNSESLKGRISPINKSSQRPQCILKEVQSLHFADSTCLK